MTRDSLPPAPFFDSTTLTGISRRTFLRSGAALTALSLAKLRASALALPLPSPLSRAPLCLITSHPSYPPLLSRFIAKLDPYADEFICEQHLAGIQPLLDTWAASVRSSAKDTHALRLLLSESISANSLKPARTIPLRSTGPLRTERHIFAVGQFAGPDKFIEEWAAYTAPFASIETFELQIYGVRTIPTTTNNAPIQVETDVHFNLVGTTHSKSREQRAGTWQLTWIRSDPAQRESWTIHKWSADSEIRSVLTGPSFTEITGHAIPADTPGMAQLLPGIDSWRTVLDGASGIDVYGNQGVAVGDFDGSGFDGFYVCQPSGLPNRLYRNRGDGTFEDVTAASGTGILDGTASALFVDFQNRGLQDLLVVRISGPLLFRNMGNGRFEPQPDAFHFARPAQGTFTSAAVADYNRDGFLDVYLCVYSFYKGLDHHQYPSPYYDAQNGPPNFLFRNRGDGTFEDVTQSSGMDQNNNRFSFAAAWCDYDNDGWPDIYIANDFGRKNLYHNNRDGTFTDIAAQAGVEDYGPGMSICWADLDNNGLQDMYVANMWLAEGQRITADDQFLPGVDPAVRKLYQKHNAGNSLYANRGTGSFEDRTASAGAAMAGWSWSSAAWDFDNDGWSDLYVANGFVSAANHFDLQSFFWRQVAQRSATPRGASPDYEMAWNAINELVRSDYSWSGYQRNVCFANNGDGSFSEAAGVLGLDCIDDSRAFALSDFDHDGRQEIVLKNRTGPQLRILRNNLEGIGNSIAFQLAGRESNRDAIGAVVTIELGAQRQTKFVSAGSGFASQHSKELFFGLGSASQPISISVRWPTGKLAHYDNLPINHRVLIEEGNPAIKATPYRIRPKEKPLASAALNAPPLPETANTWLIAPLHGPDLSLPDLNGEVHKLSSLQGKPVLLTFLRTDCGDSHAQLELLQKAASNLANAGLALFAVALSSGADSVAARSSAADLSKSTRISFPLHLADERAAGAWNIQYRYLFDRRRDMPLPLSFLLNADGAILRVYRAVVDATDVIGDWKTAPVTPEERVARALPFPGPYYGAPMKHDYLTFGIAFSEYGYPDEAQASFQRAVDADPSQEFAWFNLGTIYLNKQMYPQARKCLTEAVRLNPRDSDGWNNLGSISGMEGQYDQAIDQFRRAAQANPNHLNAIENLMRIYQFQGRTADAQKSMEELIALAPENAALHFNLALTLVAQNELQKAREELETSIRLQPSNPDVINNLGAVLLRMGLPREALEKFEECRRLAPDFDRAAINCAVLYNRAGQREKAHSILEEFLTRHPDNTDVRTALNKLGPE